MPELKPLSEQELVDWERWSKREITWQGRDVARLIAMIRQLQKQLAEFQESSSQT
jgi:hypothetical protein